MLTRALLVLTGDCEDVVLDLDLDLLGLDSGNVGAHDQVAVLAHDVDRRRPCARAAFGQLVSWELDVELL